MHRLGRSRAAQAYEKPCALGLLTVFNIWMYLTAELCMLWHAPGDQGLDSHKPWRYCWEDLEAVQSTPDNQASLALFLAWFSCECFTWVTLCLRGERHSARAFSGLTASVSVLLSSAPMLFGWWGSSSLGKLCSPWALAAAHHHLLSVLGMHQTTCSLFTPVDA